MEPIVASGDFFTVGRTVGRRTAEDIAFQHHELVPEILRDAFGGDELALRRAARHAHQRAAEFWPEGVVFIEGLARGAEMALDTLLPIVYCEEIALGPSSDAMGERCSTLLIRTTEGWAVGHQEDYVKSFYGRLGVYDLRFDGYPRMVSLNYPGNYPGVAGSLNAAGVAITNNSLWPEVQEGIPKQVRHFRATLEESLLGAVAWLAFGPSALTDHFTVLSGEEDLAMSVEVTDHPAAHLQVELREIVHDRETDMDVSVLAPFWHANHVRWLEPWVSGTRKDPANRSSRLRGEKLRQICEKGTPTSVSDLTDLLTRTDGVLKRDPDRDLTGSATVTLATTVIHPSNGWITFHRYGPGGADYRAFRV